MISAKLISELKIMRKISYVSFLGVLVFSAISCERPNKAEEVKEITQKVADWQISTFDDMGKYRALPSKENRKKWHHRKRYHDLEWQCAALYAGMYEWSQITDNPKYINWLNIIGERNNWMLHERLYHADDHAVGQFYLSLFEKYQDDNMLMPTYIQFDNIMYGNKADVWHWDWCDALFMAPPVWTRLSKITKEKSFLNYMDKQYRMTYDTLWDTKEHLFFRDKSYLASRDENGKKLFWARGNGWVFGGLALMIPDFPNDWEGKSFYVNIFKDMAETLKNIQRTDGTWSSSLLGKEEEYIDKETSGTSFFTFGLAWGINNGILDKKTYLPVVNKAWEALIACIQEEGFIGYVQPVGAAPGESFKNYTEVYGTGAFLAAGTEVYKLYAGAN